MGCTVGCEVYHKTPQLIIAGMGDAKNPPPLIRLLNKRGKSLANNSHFPHFCNKLWIINMPATRPHFPFLIHSLMNYYVTFWWWWCLKLPVGNDYIIITGMTTPAILYRLCIMSILPTCLTFNCYCPITYIAFHSIISLFCVVFPLLINGLLFN